MSDLRARLNWTGLTETLHKGTKWSKCIMNDVIQLMVLKVCVCSHNKAEKGM